MNTHIKNLANQALASTQWSVVNNLSTEVVDKNTELEKFTELFVRSLDGKGDPVSVRTDSSNY